MIKIKKIFAKLIVLSYASALSFALEPMVVVPEENASTRSAIQSIRLQGLSRLKNTEFHFGSKKLMEKAPDLKKILNGLKVENGIFFLTADEGNTVLYCDQKGRINSSLAIRYSKSIFGVRTDMVIFEWVSFNYWTMPSLYKEIVLSNDCWVMTKGDDVLCFTYKNAGLAFKGFTDPATFVTPETVKTRYASVGEMLPVLKTLCLILHGKAPAVYDLDLAQRKLEEFNYSITQRDRRAREVSNIRWHEERKRQKE